MEDEDGNQIIVTSPKKKTHRLEGGGLVRQMSGDMRNLMTEDDDSDGEYIEEVIDEDTENDSVEEIISSSEEEDSNGDDDEEEDTDDDCDDSEDDVEIETIDDEDDDGVEDGSESHSDFDPLPPPIDIPDALKPPHLRQELEAIQKKYANEYDEDSDLDDDSDSSDDSDGPLAKVKVARSKPVPKKPTIPTSSKTNFSYNAPDTSSGSDDDSDTSLSSTEKKDKKGNSTAKPSILGKINKNGDDYDEDDEKESEKPATQTKMSPIEPEKASEPEPEKIETENKKKVVAEPAPKLEVEKAVTLKGKEPVLSHLNEDPTTALRPTSMRGNSFVSVDGLPEDERRGGKKPSKWSVKTDSTLEQGPFDKKSESPGIRDSFAVKNEPIKKGLIEKEESAPEASPVKKPFKKGIIITKEVNVEEDWNTEPKDDGNGPYYSYEDLKNKKIPDLDYLNREKYLSPYDFMAVFKVTKAEFETWPKWKKTKTKRTHKLF